MKERAAAGGPIIRLKISAVPTTGTVIVVASATSDQEARARSAKGAIPRACGAVGEDRGEQQRAVEERERGEDRGGERDRGRELVGADAEDLAEQQRVDLGRVFDAEAEEQRAEPEHEDERQRGGDVVAAAAAEHPDAERAAEREHAEPDDRVDADQAGGGGAGERAVGDRVGDERRAAQHDEEPDRAADDGDDRARRSRR